MNDLPDSTPISTSQAQGPLLSLFVACYNEEENVFGTLTNVRDACQEVGITYEIIVVDDGSKDRTSEVIQSWVKENPEIPLRLVRNPANCGLAYSYIMAASMATGEWYRLICGDDVETKEALVKIFSQTGKAEIVLPYHITSLGKSILRRQISTIYTLLINIISGHWVHYYNGLPIIRRQYALQFGDKNMGFAFQADLVTQLLDMGLSLLEIPVPNRERKGGSSNALTKKNFTCVSRVLGRIFLRRLRNIFRRPSPVNIDVKSQT